MRYWISLQDGKSHGPYEVSAVRSYLSEGRINMQALACPEGGSEWRAISSIPELAGAATGSPAAPPPVAPFPVPPRSPVSVDPALAVVLPVGVDPVALLAGYVGLFSVLLVPAPFALALGVWSLVRLRGRPGSRGHVRAILGVVLGGIFTVLAVVLLVASFSS